MNKMIYTLPGQIQSFGIWLLGATILLVCAAILSATKLPVIPRLESRHQIVVPAIEAGDWNFVVYPNPAHGLVNIEWSGPATGTVIPIEVQGSSSPFTIFLPAEEHIQQINVTNWPAGTYQLQVGSGASLATREIVIQ